MSKKEINQENDVYFLGSGKRKIKKQLFDSKSIWLITGLCILSCIVTLCVIFLTQKKKPESYFDPENSQVEVKQTPTNENSFPQNTTEKGFIETLEETVNDVPMFIYVPHNLEMSLAIGVQNKADSSIVFIAQAADIRADNLDIVGDFVLNGKQLSRGTAKTGFCAIIDGNITIGVGEGKPILKKAIESKGGFFRQYPLVSNGEVVENNPKNKAIRRALAVRLGKIVMVESRSMESFHDFSQALVDIGVSDAIYLVGSTAYGWYYGQDHVRHEFGIEQSSLPGNTSYIIWRSK